MYVIDLAHYLDAQGAIAPDRDPARKIAEFVAAVVAHASDFDRSDGVPGPHCFKCRKRDHHVVTPASARITSSSGAAGPAAPRGGSRTGKARSGT
jgi:hypothetical protein